SGSAFVKDLGSANGTFLNGQRARLTPLASGDVIRIGDTSIRVELADRGGTVHISPHTPPPAELRNPDLRISVPGYELGRCLGEGATSAVFKASAPGGRLVAIKVLRTLESLADDDRQRFIREAETAAALEHPNVVATLGHGQSGPHLYTI